jgi:hypothetical protein
MKTILAAAVAILSSLLAPQASAATPVEASLTLPHDHVLPGVPFDIVVTYTNTSDRPVTVGGATATLVVTFASGETSVMHHPETGDRWSLSSSAPLRLAPGQSGQQAASWENGSIPNWFRYASFSGPGTYGIALDLQIVNDSHEPLATVRTAPVSLTRIEPVGIDAELWKRMQDMSGGKWADNSFQSTKPGAALADEIIQLHPASGYYPFVLALRALRRPNSSHIPALLEAAERFSASPAQPYLLKAAADSAHSEGLNAAWEHDTSAALKYFELARSNYSAALDTKSVAVRAGAEEGLRDVALGLERVTKKTR